jgi:hypothetical protein
MSVGTSRMTELCEVSVRERSYRVRTPHGGDIIEIDDISTSQGEP